MQVSRFRGTTAPTATATIAVAAVRGGEVS
jgi:hypothetical protein